MLKLSESDGNKIGSLVFTGNPLHYAFYNLPAVVDWGPVKKLLGYPVQVTGETDNKGLIVNPTGFIPIVMGTENDVNGFVIKENEIRDTYIIFFDTPLLGTKKPFSNNVIINYDKVAEQSIDINGNPLNTGTVARASKEIYGSAREDFKLFPALKTEQTHEGPKANHPLADRGPSYDDYEAPMVLSSRGGSGGHDADS